MEFDSLLQNFQHGQKRDPHPQYKNFMYFQAPLHSNEDTVIKLVDTTIQSNMTNVPEQERTFSYVTFTMLVHDVSTNSGAGTSRSLIDVSARFGYDGIPRLTAGSTPISGFEDGGIPLIVQLKKTGRTQCNEYSLKIFVKTPTAYTRLRFSIIDFYTSNWPFPMDNSYQISGNEKNPIHLRMDFLFKSILSESGSSIPQTEAADISYTSLQTKNKSVVESDGKFSATIDEITEIILVQSSDTDPANRNLRYIYAKKSDLLSNGRKISLIFKSDNISVTSQENYSNGLLLKNNLSIVPPLNGVINLIFIRGTWYECSRSF
ncbi:hypothetical protein [Enterococcus xiangfangensis]|uniref:hypothetical protein n=1 Tax=Enterococcus xiangfangensis TaxID=1296537 RepID=UPI003D1858D5|nr:hypothetical protein [Enterococcus asini]